MPRSLPGGTPDGAGRGDARLPVGIMGGDGLPTRSRHSRGWAPLRAKRPEAPPGEAVVLLRPGFDEVGDPEAAAIHRWIARFNNPRDWPPADLPKPVLVGRVVAAIDDPQRQLFAACVHRAMKTLVPPGGYLHHADLQHWYGRFYPHVAPILPFEDLFTEGETGGFVTLDGATGIVSIDWDGPTLACFFGERLVSALAENADHATTARLWPFLDPA